uniref:NADH-ubiquinone oxidoreductase chain 4 n=1 Tax=Wickerhamomyces canadensis TaxID=1156965 RepID=NU4M_WICCA|nr:NADH dehydrogenase subunit 4 [Wickerhamomyces canadensis]P48917.2 RecName: Full=NADH-ubiquinone oxidoreductase chain 4; AltName: Full=NADH dehydrogenase subunit 4 [Wickerhamomyces canadensis]BAA06575.2 NADH dehydrogenase subunit 4 [Wickerhamomyces canadensis]
MNQILIQGVIIIISLLSIIIINQKDIILINIKNKYIKQISLLLIIYFIYIGIYINYLFNNNILGFQLINNYININWGIDGISLWLINLTLILLPISLISNWNISKNEDKSKVLTYVLLILIIGIIIILNFICLDLITFYILFEATLLPLFILIGKLGSLPYNGNNKIIIKGINNNNITPREKAAYYIFIYTLFSSLFMLLSIGIYIYMINNIDYNNIYNIILSIDLQSIIFIGLIIGILVKTPVFPVHTWLPLVHAESPISGSIILAGIIIKLAIYAIIRLILINLSDVIIIYNPLIYTIGILTIFYIGLITLKQIDIKVIIAYSSIIHMAIAIMSIFSNNILGIEGSLLISIAHGFASPALFLLVGGILYDRYHSRLIYYYQSLATYMPIFSIYLLIAGLFNMGIPLSLNFIGEFLSLNGIFIYNSLFAILSTFSLFITTIYQMKLTTKLLYGYKSIYINIWSIWGNDVNKRELLLLNILFFFIILFGIYPNLIIKSLNLSISSLLYIPF